MCIFVPAPCVCILRCPPPPPRDPRAWTGVVGARRCAVMSADAQPSALVLLSDWDWGFRLRLAIAALWLSAVYTFHTLLRVPPGWKRLALAAPVVATHFLLPLLFCPFSDPITFMSVCFLSARMPATKVRHEHARSSAVVFESWPPGLRVGGAAGVKQEMMILLHTRPLPPRTSRHVQVVALCWDRGPLAVQGLGQHLFTFIAICPVVLRQGA